MWKTEGKAPGTEEITTSMFPIPLLIRLLLLPYMLYRWLTGQGRATFDLEQWAEERDMEVVEMEPCGLPPYSAEQQFPYRTEERLPYPRGMGGEFLYFRLTVIDQNHVRRSGFARVHNETRPFYEEERVVDFAWVRSEQLNWRERPRRRSAELPSDRSEGWYVDHTGAHELRWYSVGTPTDLVKDGEIESRDSPK
jgi:hypothetical protein